MKTEMTAEQFEEIVDKLKAKCDRIVRKVNKITYDKTQALYKTLSEDQQARAQRRLVAKIRKAKEDEIKQIQEMSRKIVDPGSIRFN